MSIHCSHLQVLTGEVSLEFTRSWGPFFFLLLKQFSTICVKTVNYPCQYNYFSFTQNYMSFQINMFSSSGLKTGWGSQEIKKISARLASNSLYYKKCESIQPDTSLISPCICFMCTHLHRRRAFSFTAITIKTWQGSSHLQGAFTFRQCFCGQAGGEG